MISYRACKFNAYHLIKHLNPFLIFLLICSIFCVLFKIYQFASFNGIGSEFVYYYEQTFWNTANGRFMITGREVSYFAEHAAFIQVLIFPLYYLFQSPYTLLVIHGLACSFATIPLYKLSRHFFKNKNISLAICFNYIVLIYIQKGLEYEVHLEMFYPLLLFSMIYFLVKEKWFCFYVFLFLSLLVKEDISIPVIVMGIFIYFYHGKKHGIIVSLTGILYFLFVFLFFIPHFRNDNYQFISYWSAFGSSRSEMIINMLNPVKEFEVLFKQEKIYTLMIFFATFAFLPCLSWKKLILLAAPGLFIVFSSNNRYLYLLTGYYGLFLVPFLFFITILNLKAASEKWDFLSEKKIFYLLLIIITGNFFYSKTLERVGKVFFWSVPPRIETVKNMIHIIPDTASVEAQENLISHIPPRKTRILYPEGYGTEYIIVDKKGVKAPAKNDEEYTNGIQKMEKDSNYVIIADENDYLLLKKRQQ